MLKWNDDYLINIDKIDAQHKMLFEIATEANEILKLPSYMDRYDDILALIKRLQDYTVFHFTSEEEIMEEIKYPKRLTHKIEHATFIAQIKDVDLTIIDEDQQTYILKIIKFIIDWIVSHILNVDKEMAKHYHGLHKK